MQAPVLKRATLTQIAGLALVLGLVGSIAIGVAMGSRSEDHASSPNDAYTSSTQIARATHLFEIKLDQFDSVQAVISRQALAAARESHFDSKLKQLDAALARLGQNPASPARSRLFEDQLDQLESGH